RHLQKLLSETVPALDAGRLDDDLLVTESELLPGVALGRGFGRAERPAGERQGLVLRAHVHAVDEIAIVLDGALEQALHVEERVVEREATQSECVILRQHRTFAGYALFDVLLRRAQ